MRNQGCLVRQSSRRNEQIIGANDQAVLGQIGTDFTIKDSTVIIKRQTSKMRSEFCKHMPGVFWVSATLCAVVEFCFNNGAQCDIVMWDLGHALSHWRGGIS